MLRFDILTRSAMVLVFADIIVEKMMQEQKKPTRGLSLFSGGLDSQLAICVLREQGIEMEGVVFKSPFFEVSSAVKTATALNMPLHVKDFTADILELIEKPRHGFGTCMNPCIDCHARMLLRAGEMMAEGGFDFISTGEVLGQRPMSQRRQALDMVAKDSGIRDFVLRPLSALKLPPTIVELNGLVDRSRLLGLSGRSRKPQLELAEKYGLKDYPSPAGGCRLTEPNYSRRLKDLKEHEGLEELRLLDLLRVGRHLRLPGGSRIIVGRQKKDNETIRAAAAPPDMLLRAVEVPGPTVLILNGSTGEDLALSFAICASYADHEGASDVLVRATQRNREAIEMRISPLAREAFRDWIL